VSAGGPALDVRPVRHASDVVDVLTRYEPRSTQALGEILDRGLPSRTCRAWTVGGSAPAGEPAAVVVEARATFDRWHAMVLLLEPSAAAAAAQLVDRGRSWTVHGAATDIGPLVPLLGRRRAVHVRPWVVTSVPNDVTTAPDDGTRIATLADLEALVELYSGFEFAGTLTRWQLRPMLRHVLDHHYILVVDDPRQPGQLCAALAITTRARRYGVIDLLTVVPDQRRSGWSWALIARAQEIGNGLGQAGVAALADSNPLDLDEHLGDDHYVAVDLAPPRRFRGHGRLRALYGRIQPLSPREAEPAGRPPEGAGS
jgi:hypothetical protein